nr:immunoglobulin light chain junction region [Macaca mulatta]
CLQHHSFPHSF